MYSLIIPVYKNEDSIPDLLEMLPVLNRKLKNRLEVVFVVDGSPDRCFEVLDVALKKVEFRTRLLLLTRNFGSFAAIRTGLAVANGPYFAVMAADLQEPSKLILEFFETLESEEIDVTIGMRIQRDDPYLSRFASKLFWKMYTRYVQNDIPPGGVDVFGCNVNFRNQLIKLEEANSSLIGQIFWLGFRRKTIEYRRLARKYGNSTWTLSKKINYMLNSIFSFTDLPIKVVTLTGLLGISISTTLAFIVLLAKLFNLISIPGYTAIILSIVFFTALNLFALGIIGSYIWRAFENTKRRPESLILFNKDFTEK
ncbi:MAG: glycosyltransferase family 2 protein [Planctomycetota bacterium]